MKKVFLDELSRWGNGKGSGHGNEGTINWGCINNNLVKFIYDNINGEFILKNYNSETRKVSIVYKNEEMEIDSASLATGKIGFLIQKDLFIKKYEKRILSGNYICFDVKKLPFYKRGGINWNDVAKNRMFFTFKYLDIIDELQVIKYLKNKQTVEIIYKEKNYTISTNSLVNCNLGYIVGYISKDYKYGVGEKIITKTGKIQITELIRGDSNEKCYLYKCLEDGYIGKIVEGDIKKGNGCPICSNKKVLIGVNDVATTHPELIKYFINKDDANKYTYGSNKSILLKCPDCGHEKNIKLHTLLKYGFGCNQCSDGISYPNKFIFNALKQIMYIKDFKAEKQFLWSKKIKHNNKKISGNKQYDFYIHSLNLIIEVHGRQHYEDAGFETIGGRSLEEERENDRLKEQLAKENGIENYIVIDCRKSELEFIKNSILNSKLAELFDLSKIDWVECEEFSISNRVKEVSDLWNNGMNNLTKISEFTGLEKSTVKKYINRGLKLGWNNYDAKLENIKSALNQVENLKKKVLCIENGIIFESCHDLDRNSNDIFGFHIDFRSVSNSCKKNKPYKGYTFLYI